MTKSDEQAYLNSVTLVDKSNQILGSMDKWTAHRYPLQLHRAVSVWLFDERGQVLLQQRSAQKIIGAGEWANTVCGNVRFGESNEYCAYRRLAEELGIGERATWAIPKVNDQDQLKFVKTYQHSIGVVLKPVYQFIYQAYGNKQYGEYEYDQVFVGQVKQTDLSLQVNPQEVQDVLWLSNEELAAQLASLSLPTAAETLEYDFVQLKQKTRSKQVIVCDRKLTIAFWTLLMGHKLWLNHC